MEHKEFITYCSIKFKSVKNPSDLLSDAQFMSIFNAYYVGLFWHKPLIYKCGVCLYEYYREIADLTDEQIKNRKAMTHAIKENKILWGFDGRPYSRKSANINTEMLDYLMKKYPEAFEPVPRAKIEVQKIESEPLMPITEVKKRRRTKKTN